VVYQFSTRSDGYVWYETYLAAKTCWLVNSATLFFSFLKFLIKGSNQGFWGEEHFNASDINGDGLLNLTEFNEYAPFFTV
jgi:hypothetical protein